MWCALFATKFQGGELLDSPGNVKPCGDNFLIIFFNIVVTRRILRSITRQAILSLQV